MMENGSNYAMNRNVRFVLKGVLSQVKKHWSLCFVLSRHICQLFNFSLTCLSVMCFVVLLV
jgi:hypothetical protein